MTKSYSMLQSVILQELQTCGALYKIPRLDINLKPNIDS